MNGWEMLYQWCTFYEGRPHSAICADFIKYLNYNPTTNIGG